MRRWKGHRLTPARRVDSICEDCLWQPSIVIEPSWRAQAEGFRFAAFGANADAEHRATVELDWPML